MNTTYQYIITTFVLDTMLRHVGMVWITENDKQLKYDMDEQNSDWMTGIPWYNTSICKKLHGKLFEVFIRNARTDRYYIRCSIDAYGKYNQSASCDNVSSGGGCKLTTNTTTEVL